MYICFVLYSCTLFCTHVLCFVLMYFVLYSCTLFCTHVLCFVLMYLTVITYCDIMYLSVITYCDIREMLFADKRKNILMTKAKCIR